MKSVLQLTDLHIFEDANRTLLPIDTKESFKRVLDFALADDEDWDLIVLSGDLADLGEAASYAWIAEVFSELEIPTVAVAGNHDDRAHLETPFQRHIEKYVHNANHRSELWFFFGFVPSQN